MSGSRLIGLMKPCLACGSYACRDAVRCLRATRAGVEADVTFCADADCSAAELPVQTEVEPALVDAAAALLRRWRTQDDWLEATLAAEYEVAS
jgi:hypothetical protein